MGKTGETRGQVDGIWCAPEGDARRAGRLARALGCSVQEGAPADGALALVFDADGLWLFGDGMRMRGDFAAMAKRTRPANLSHELLVRAAKVKGVAAPHVVDATAGMGEDAFLLAAAGFRVTLFERDPVIAALLSDALDRAVADERTANAAARMTFVEGDSIEALVHWEAPAPDVVLLDPMFPERRKSAAVKKKFQLIHRLERPCADEAELLAAARAALPRKIVVKRPPKGPHLAGAAPSYSLQGKAVRYDCYV
ncbi:MAG: class I SAM-dependent methyltransferase [Eggerthellaceae bacterium]|jgi:16S rRNA (guanine1516-N2)-methyltransferase|nr:class I SAM-dependent methyltransferase [Eggerthellaceae bacterium]